MDWIPSLSVAVPASVRELAVVLNPLLWEVMVRVGAMVSKIIVAFPEMLSCPVWAVRERVLFLWFPLNVRGNGIFPLPFPVVVMMFVPLSS
jgi:hypothetical protein